MRPFESSLFVSISPMACEERKREDEGKKNKGLKDSSLIASVGTLLFHVDGGAVTRQPEPDSSRSSYWLVAGM
jgi:hypothetical protein